MSRESDEMRRTSEITARRIIRIARNLPLGEAYTDGVIWGAWLCHRALREEAQTKGGILPQLRNSFVDRQVDKMAGEIQRRAQES